MAASGGGADQRDHLVDIGDGDGQADQDVAAVARLGELEARAARDHLLAEQHEGGDHLLEIHQLGTAAIERQHVDAEARLQFGETIELVQHHLAEASRFSSITTRMPWRSLSSRMSEMPSMRLSRTSSAIFSCIRALFT